MKKIEAKIVADSISPTGHRITTMLLTFPRFILAELNTHRMFSRNSASSRAIPFAKMVKMVEEDPFIPIAWQKDHKGMQGVEYFTSKKDIEVKEMYWISASKSAINMAQKLNSHNTTKQLCNRLLEPFMWHTALVTATEWENFFELRCPKYSHTYLPDRTFNSKKDVAIALSKYASENRDMGAEEEAVSLDTTKLLTNTSQAEIHMQALAEAMWDARSESTPKELKEGEWHTPFGDKIDDRELAFAEDLEINEETDNELVRRLSRQKVSIARCARLSYMTFDGEIDYAKDIALHDHLLKSGHMSPFEHIARCMTLEEEVAFRKGHHDVIFNDQTENTFWEILEEDYNRAWCNNFQGWIPYRYLVE